MTLVMTDDFVDHEAEELLGEVGIEVRLLRQVFEPRDLGRLSGGIGRGKVVPGLELARRPACA
jgi:hypothetical protein